MCGIAGTINCALTEKSVSLIDHRGPDAQGLTRITCGPNDVFFGHTRLSILDLSEAGSQPMFSVCRNYCIVFNGEIYNHNELRKKLRGVSFAGQSDTETILYYLREFGIEGVKDFNGIFSFAFLDLRTQKIYLVRDWFGIKPLYYYTTGNKLIFSSELKIIVTHPAYKSAIDTEALNSFMTFRYNPAPQTLFKDVHKLEAATYLEWDRNGETRFTNYWPKQQKINTAIDEGEAVEEYKRLLERAVKRQLLSDVPVGLLLSGGLDSAVLGQLMAKHYPDKIKSFTVGFEGKGAFNELADARTTADFIGSEHHEIFMDKAQYMDYFYKSFYHTEEPIAEPTIPALMFVSNLASQWVKVVLSGQGADEPMAGYKRYRGEKLIADYGKILNLLPLSLVAKAFRGNATVERGLHSLQFREDLDRFIGIYTLFTPALKRSLYQPEYLSGIRESQRFLFDKHYGRTDAQADSLSKLLFLDTRTMLPDNLLLFNDKLTMASSIENRVPYLDIDLINFIESLPIGLKLKGRKGKYIHKKAAADWLPDSIINRKKRGFETPVGDWFRQELSGSLLDLTEAPDSFSRQYFNLPFIREMIAQNKAGRKDYKKNLFIILSLELWYKNFYREMKAGLPVI